MAWSDNDSNSHTAISTFVSEKDQISELACYVDCMLMYLGCGFFIKILVIVTTMCITF